ncbi:MAG: prephenate dehydratase [Bacteroidales bacterium]|nr:prephenate dehydratase [Bacteroidales bacterium]
MRIAIQGVRGAFHEVAAREYFNGQDLDIVEKMTFEDVLDSVVAYESDYGMFAIENTIAGTIHANLSLLRVKDVRICGEIFIRIKQNLAVLPGVAIEDLTEVRSHYMAITQTRQFFRKYPHIKLVECEDTALALRQVSEGQLDTVGAIGGELAAGLYGLDIIADGIETNKKNYTRFFVVSRTADSMQDNYNKASLNIVLSNHLGSLAQILSIISYYGIDLTKIESLPILGQPLNYMFYIDLRFDDKNRYQNMLTAIRPLVQSIQILGEYEEGEISWAKIHKQ